MGRKESVARPGEARVGGAGQLGEMTKDVFFIASGFTEQSAEGQKGDEYIGYHSGDGRVCRVM